MVVYRFLRLHTVELQVVYYFLKKKTRIVNIKNQKLKEKARKFCLFTVCFVLVRKFIAAHKMTTNIDMRLASTRIDMDLDTGSAMPRLYTPGEIITTEQGFMR